MADYDSAGRSRAVPPIRIKIMVQLLSILVILGAVFGAGFLLLRPQWTFVLVIVMFPLEQLLQTYIPFLATNQAVTNYGIAILACVAVVMRLMRSHGNWVGFINPVWLLTMGLYVLWLLGHLWTPGSEYMYPLLGYHMRYQFLMLLVLPLLITDLEDFKRMTWGLLFMGSLIAALIFANPHASYWGTRFTLDLGMTGNLGDRGNPLALAEMGAMSALIAAMILPARASWLYMLLRIAAFVLGFGLAIGSGSRGQVMAACIAGVLFYPMGRRLASPRHFFGTIIGLLFIVGGLLLVFRMFVDTTNEQRWAVDQLFADTLLRLNYVRMLFQWYVSEPMSWLFGLGSGAYSVISDERGTVYVHNVAAEILCENGVIAFGIFIALIVLTLKSGTRLWHRHRDNPQLRATAALLLAISLFALLQALKQGTIAYPAPFFWWIILAKIAACEDRLAVPEARTAGMSPYDDHAEALNVRLA